MIRVVIVCSALIATILGIHQIQERPNYALSNEYVNVSVAPPPTGPPRLFLSDCFLLESNDLLMLWVPSQIRPLQPNLPAPDHVLVSYIKPRELYGCGPKSYMTYIGVELKSKPAKSIFGDDAVQSDSTHNEVLFENEVVRVVRIHFAPGESGPMVDKRPRVIVAVTDSDAIVIFPDGHREPRDMKAGAVSFGKAGRQATKNIGNTPLENIVVELKSK